MNHTKRFRGTVVVAAAADVDLKNNDLILI